MAKSHSGKILIIDDSLKYFTYIKSSADRLLGLINNLLDLAEIGTNQDAYFFSIRDRGLTIPADELKTVFKKFSQSSIKINNIEGTGLGLTISKEIIDAHHGKIWLENHPGGGVLSCFIIPNQQNE